MTVVGVDDDVDGVEYTAGEDCKGSCVLVVVK